MAQGGFKTLPLSIRGLIMGGGVIAPISPFGGSPVRTRTVISGLDIRNPSQRLRVDSPNNETLKDVRGILSQALDAIQANADVQDDRFRQLSTSVNSVGITKDPAGNIVLSGATFTVRIGLTIFQLALGGMIFPLPAAAPEDDRIPNGGGQMWLDEVGDLLMFRVRYSDGTLKSGSIALV